MLRQRHKNPRRLPVPPGPPASVPWIRHAFQMPTSYQWVTFREWTETYGMVALVSSINVGLTSITVGNVVSVEAFGQHIVVLGSLKACIDLCERRSSVYSDRPDVPMLRDLYVWCSQNKRKLRTYAR